MGRARNLVPKALVLVGLYVVRASATELRRYALGSDLDKGGAWTYALGNVLKREFAVCAVCTCDDVARHGVSYVRRQHQIRTLAICVQHDVLLETICRACGEPLVSNGFVSGHCPECDLRIRSTPAGEIFGEPALRAFRYMGTVIDSIFQGKINGSLDLRKFAAAQTSQNRQRAILALNLASRLRTTFGLDWLNAVELNPYRRPTYSWPAIYVNRTWGTSNPSMELLLACILAEDGLIGDIWLGRRNTYPTRWHAGLPLLDSRTVKQLMRGVLPNTIAKRDGLHKKFAHGVLHAYPDLERRYWIARKKATSEGHKQSILRYIRDNPDCTKTDVRFALVAANSYLWQNDREWWDRHVGHRSGYGPPKENGRRPRLRCQLTTEQRKQIASHASKIRWEKEKREQP